MRGPAPLQTVRPDVPGARVIRFRVWIASAMWVAQPDRVELERRLLDEQLAAGFPGPDEREIVSRPDRLGLGSAA